MAKNDDCELISTNVDTPDVNYKVILIGDSGVGKSCILNRATKGSFKESHEITLGAEYGLIHSKIDGKVVRLQIWDTAGHESFKSMTKVFYKSSHAVLLIYNITNRDSFINLKDWLDEVKENAPNDVKICLIGNQNDKEKERVVTKEEAEFFLNQHELLFFNETSAKTGQGIKDLLKSLSRYLVRGTINEPIQSEKSQILKNREMKRSQGCC